MLNTAPGVPPPAWFALDDDHVALRDIARDFAAEKLAPNATRWDHEKHFPTPEMRDAAEIYTRYEAAGQAASDFFGIINFIRWN